MNDVKQSDNLGDRRCLPIAKPIPTVSDPNRALWDLGGGDALLWKYNKSERLAYGSQMEVVSGVEVMLVDKGFVSFSGKAENRALGHTIVLYGTIKVGFIECSDPT